MYLRHELLKTWEHRVKTLKIPYRKVMYGNSTVLEYADKKIYFVGNVGDEKFEGIHLISLFRRHLLKNIDTLVYDTKLKDSDLVYTWWSKDQIKRFEKKSVGIMDINSCYFETAKMMGYVDERLYKSAYKKINEYKLARNIAIGALNKRKIIKLYNKEGKLINSYPELPDERLKAIRRSIVNYVGQFSLAVFREFPSDIFMYQTDCFYFDNAIKNKLRDFVCDHGYTVKSWVGDMFQLHFDDVLNKIVVNMYDFKVHGLKVYKMGSRGEVNRWIKKYKSAEYEN